MPELSKEALPTRELAFVATAPPDTPPGSTVHLLILPFTDWAFQEHIPMTKGKDGTWIATARIEEGALLQYAYDIWDEKEWGEFKDRREATANGIPVDRRLLHVARGVTEVRDVIGGWRGGTPSRKLGAIAGRVIDQAGAPVIDSEVTVAGIHTSTDWDGAFRVEVAAGPQRVTVYRPDGGHRVAVSSVQVEAGAESPVSITVEPAPVVPVTFSVELPPDTPPGAEIRLIGSVAQLGAAQGPLNSPRLMAPAAQLPVVARSAGDRAEATFQMRAGMYVQYFYTLTGDSAGREWKLSPPRIVYRSMVVGDQPTARRDRVRSWTNPDWPTITFRVTVPPNTPSGLPIAIEMGPHSWLARTGDRTFEMQVSSVPNTEFRYRYLLGGDPKGADGSPGLDREGYRVATLGTSDTVVKDVVAKWANLPAAVAAAPGTSATVQFHVSVPPETAATARMDWVSETGQRVPMAPASGNRWIVEAGVELPVGVATRYRIVATGTEEVGFGPWRTVTPRFANEAVNDWVARWDGGPRGSRPRLDYLAGYYTPDLWSPHYQALSDSTFDRIARHGGNLVAISSVWSYGRIKPSPVVEARPVEAPSVLTPRQDVIEQIATARRLGLQVLLAPQFNMEMSPGGIDALNDNSTRWWGEWLREAERLWMWNAQLAAETKAEMLLLPGFVFHVFAGPWAFESQQAFEGFNGQLAALVAKVKTVYNGKLLISGGVRESAVPGLADLVGVTTYDTGHPELAASATVEEWRAAYDALFKTRLDPIYERWRKPVFFYTIHLPAHPDDPDTDGQVLQARRLEGLLQALESRTWVAGSLSWAYDMIDAPLTESDGLRARRAEAVLAKYYQRHAGVDFRAPEPPVLTRPIVDLEGTFDPVTARLAALDCNFVHADSPHDRWCFNAFGTTAIPGKVIGSFDYKVAAGAGVFAASPGEVVSVALKEAPDFAGEYEIHVRTSPDSPYLVIYDHVRDVKVAVGSPVVAGSALGVAGIHRGDPARYGRVELQVNYARHPRDLGQVDVICPAVFGTEEFVASHWRALAAHNVANPQYASRSLCLVNEIQIGR